MKHRFAVTNTTPTINHEKLLGYKSVLEKYNLETIPVAHYLCDEGETSELLYITLNSLDELLALKKELNQEIILCDSYYDEFSNFYEEPTILIYDGCIA